MGGEGGRSSQGGLRLAGVARRARNDTEQARPSPAPCGLGCWLRFLPGPGVVRLPGLHTQGLPLGAIFRLDGRALAGGRAQTAMLISSPMRWPRPLSMAGLADGRVVACAVAV